jgi:predicted nucleic acid-binding protein
MNEPVLVVDASAAVAFSARQERSDDVERALEGWRSGGHQIVVPPHFWLEVINALSGRGRWTGAAVLEALVELERLGMTTVRLDRPLVLLALDLVERHGLISYDAAYLALAIQRDARLLTLDRRLAAAAGPRLLPIGSHGVSESPPAYERSVTWPNYRGASAFLAKLRADALRGI